MDKHQIQGIEFQKEVNFLLYRSDMHNFFLFKTLVAFNLRGKKQIDFYFLKRMEE